MKAKSFILALVLVFSLLGTPLVNANTGGPQDGNDTRAKCPNGYIRVGSQCVKVRATALTPSGESEPEVIDIDDSIVTGIVNGVWFYIFSSLG